MANEEAKIQSEAASEEKPGDEEFIFVPGEPEAPDEDESEKESKEDPAEEAEKESPPGEDETKAEIERLKAEFKELQTDKRNLQIALHQERQSKKTAKKEEEAPLSIEQLRALWKEHQDDPDTLFNIANYMAEQKAKGVKTDAISEAEIKRKTATIQHYVLENYPALADENSEIRQTVNNTKQQLGINEHPFGDYFALGVQVLHNLPVMFENARKAWESENQKKAAETNRKQDVKSRTLSPSGKGSGDFKSPLSPSQLEAAKQMGLKGDQLKTYARLVSKKAASITVEE